MVMRVAVIGAGAAGLCALRHLTARPAVFEAVGFEQLPGVGGTWRYSSKIGTNENGLPVHSGLYKNLRTNLPKEVMAFPDYPFPEYLSSYVHHTDVLKYLQDYCEHFQLADFIKFETKVDVVDPIRSEDDKDGPAVAWRVSYSCVSNPKRSWTETFDAVIVCNGHFTEPLIPDVKGLDQFQGTVLHCHEYREPEMFTDHTVVCLGAASSGKDVSLDIATVAKKVVISHNKGAFVTVLPDNVFQQAGVDHLTHDSVVYKNGDKDTIDGLVFCTGYRYHFPFLTEQCNITIDDGRVTPLYKHLISTKHPTLSLVGLCNNLSPNLQIDTQVKFVLRMLDGSHRLPTMKEMEDDEEADFQKRLHEGLSKRHAHKMEHRQEAYNDGLADLAGFERLRPAVYRIFDNVLQVKDEDLLHFKSCQYRFTGDNSFEVLHQ